MKRMFFTMLAAMLMFVVNYDEVQAQATAQISGTARDQSGAVLPGVEINVTQTDTGISRETITNETGSYVLPNLAIGPYRLEASLPGFRTYAQTGIVLQVNSSPVVNVILEVGQVAETVEVQANAALVETRSAGIGSVVENSRILELPLNGRAVVELVALAGAATPAPLLSGAQRDPFTKGNVSVAGGMHTGLGYTLDGATHFNPYTSGYMSLPFPDALQEFKVETGATGAQTGMKSSGSVSLVTKSGTNEFHGNMFEFVRNGMFNARNAFSPRRDTIKRNQFGGTFGGPIVQNKLFFFGAYQGTLVRQDPADLTAFVPTAAMLAGDFTAVASPACNAGRQITLRAPFVNNQINPAQFSKAAVLLSNKLAGTSDPCGKTIYGMPKLEDGHTIVGRIDYQRSANHSIFGRYLFDYINIPPPYDITKNLVTSTGIATGNNGLAQAFTFGDTYLFSANIVNALRLAANRIFAEKSSPDFASSGAGPIALGIKAFSYLPERPFYSVTGGFNTGYNGVGPIANAIFSLSDDVSVLQGNHQMAFGGQVSGWQANSYSDAAAKLNFAFNGQTTGLGMADFLMGNVSQLTAGTFTEHFKIGKYLGLYGTDTWKFTQRVTLSYGLRWEPYLPLVNREGGGSRFDEAALKQGIRTARFTNAPPGLFFQDDPGFPGKTGQYRKLWNFSPRVGLAWDVAGDGRTSVRVSAGTFYDFPATQFLNGLTTGAPFAPRIITTDVRFDDPWANYPGGDPHPRPYSNSIPRDSAWQLYAPLIDMDYDTPNVRVAQWNLSIQKQVGTDWLVSTSYLGNATRHLWSIQQINPAVFLGLGPCTLHGVQYSTCSTTANTDQRRRLRLAYPAAGIGDGYGNLSRVDSGGNASYNALLVSVQRTAVRGITVSGNYTWSHCISDPWIEAINSGLGGSGWLDSNNRRLDRGNCMETGSDRRHILNLSAVAQTPQFAKATLRAIGSGWRLSPILRTLSGSYMSVTTSTDRALTGILDQRVNQLMANPYGDKSVGNYLNPAAFALPAMGTIGNSGRGSIRGPGFWQFDLALSRTFQFRESQRLEFRGEAFNITNSVRLDNPTTNLNSNIFGQITSAQDPRIMQFALKYIF